MSSKPHLLGRNSSTNVQKAKWALEELGVDYDQTEMGGPFGGLDSADYATRNPNRLVPTLIDGDLTLWESHAIMRYVAAKWGRGTMWPDDPVRRAPIDQWTDWVAFEWQPAWLGVFTQVFRLKEEFRTADAIAAAVAQAEKRLAIMDQHLQETPWLGGDTFSYADIAAGVATYRWTTLDFERTSFAGVDAWIARLQERPLYDSVVRVDYGFMANTLSA